jgi:hypothetical protein
MLERVEMILITRFYAKLREFSEELPKINQKRSEFLGKK